MSNYERYSRYLVRSVDHIFKNFLSDTSIEEVFESQSGQNDPIVAIELDGSLRGELVLNLPLQTLNMLTKRIVPSVRSNSLKKHHPDVAGEIANLIAGTFVNQLQFVKHDVKPSAPEYNDDPLAIKALYENINLSFHSKFGGFDIDLYFQENRSE